MRSYLLALFICAATSSFTQNVGIGTFNPSGQFHISTPFYFSGIIFNGTGINDIDVNSSLFSSDTTLTFEITISNAGPTPNLIRWRLLGGAWSNEIAISGSIELIHGVSILFGSATGHHYGDIWKFTISPAFPDAFIVKDGRVGVGIANPNAKLDVIGKIKVDSIAIVSGANSGLVLTSDLVGNASWGNGRDLSDFDHDTKIELKDGSGIIDTIKFVLDGEMNWKMTNKSFYPENSGNLYLGKDVGKNSNTNAVKNIAIGDHALESNINKSGLVALGDSSLYKNGLGATANYQAAKNTAVGRNTLKNNETGYNNTAVGFDALKNNLQTANNTAIGSEALFANTSGFENTAIGSASLFKNLSGYYNTSVGSFSLNNNTIGYSNSALGYGALLNNSSGSGNACVGVFALYLNSIGEYNNAFGVNALFNNRKGSHNLAIGTSALLLNSTANRNIAIGNNALSSQTFSNGDVAWNSDNLAIGYSALNNNQPSNNTNGIKNIAIGNFALNTNSQGHNNLAIGDSTLYLCNTGVKNIGIGNSVLTHLTNGEGNLCIGNDICNSLISSDFNVCIGPNVFKNNSNGSNNTVVGYASQTSAFGSYNTSFGSNSNSIYNSYSNTTALGYSSSITASNQIRIGTTNISSIGGYAGWSNLSDGRFKKNVKQNVPGLAFILKLKPITYQLDIIQLNKKLGISEPLDAHSDLIKEANREKESEILCGFIAQDVNEIADSLQFQFSGIDKPKNENDIYGLRYAEFVVPLVKAIQELNAELEKLKEENSRLFEMVNKLNR